MYASSYNMYDLLRTTTNMAVPRSTKHIYGRGKGTRKGKEMLFCVDKILHTIPHCKLQYQAPAWPPVQNNGLKIYIAILYIFLHTTHI